MHASMTSRPNGAPVPQPSARLRLSVTSAIAMPTSTPLGAAAAAPGLGPHGGFRSGVALAAPILATLTSTTNTNANRPAATAAPHPPHRPTRGASTLVRRATNGNGSAADASSSNSGGGGGGGAPSAAETARTVAAMVAEGTLSTLCPEGGCPVGTPVGFHLDKNGQAWVEPGEAGPALANLSADARCSLTVQPAAYPARSVACVTLVGQVDVSGTGPAYPLRVEKALYFGGLDASDSQQVSPEEFVAAQPDTLHEAAPELVKIWNEERAEDLYRIVSHQLGVPLEDMLYAELVWVDRLGMYVRTEVEGHDEAVVRVPFYRPVIDERDARSVITMAAQIAWESERTYTPVPVPLADAATSN